MLACICLAGCFPAGDPWRPQAAFQTVHIEQVDAPPVVRQNEPAIFTLHVSAAANPQLIGNDFELFYRTDSESFSQGVSEGGYEAGQFLGLYFEPRFPVGNSVSLGHAVTTIEIPLSFTNPGRHVLYFAHNRNSGEGGLGIAVDQYVEYPAESSFIEYLKMVVDVEPAP